MRTLWFAVFGASVALIVSTAHSIAWGQPSADVPLKVVACAAVAVMTDRLMAAAWRE